MASIEGLQSNSDNVEVTDSTSTSSISQSKDEKSFTTQKVAWNKEQEPNPEEIWFTPEWKAKWQAINIFCLCNVSISNLL